MYVYAENQKYVKAMSGCCKSIKCSARRNDVGIYIRKRNKIYKRSSAHDFWCVTEVERYVRHVEENVISARRRRASF